MASRLRYLETFQRSASEFWSGQIDTWSRVWDRAQNDDYTLGKWVNDAADTWDSWVSGAMRFAGLPDRQFQGVVPTLVLVSDGLGDTGPSNEVPAPDDIKYGNAAAILATQFSDPEFGKYFQIEATARSATKTVKVAAKANPKYVAFKDAYAAAGGSAIAGKSASAVVFQNNTPIARVILAFKP